MTQAWRWAGARSKGTSHERTGSPCQDYGCASEIESPAGPVFIAVVSDGAGSATHADVGSKLASTTLLRLAREFLAGSPRSSIQEEAVWEWLDAIRDRINVEAKRLELRPRDFAATVVAVLADDSGATVIHVGDGAVALKALGADAWTVPSWPFQGEYASTTSFVTDDPQPRLDFVTVEIQISELAVFSDGIERMVLDFTSRTPHGPFFDRMLKPITALTTPGRDIDLSKALQSYLASPAVCDRTDDDKTLILGARL
ncbi:protein phosphatase 2C domain-containing protein [Shinella kummerowiae]|uniref:Protein phosphatase 2C domain-containing protein n=1 Tax=Shinella kummerowiae TaxID=417745 RepID=A0A6N8S9D0_9HYPH|nr:PP2C family serine/threonine-protein phosphatase [Shinella kummerowiae]MXN44148.1 protein phosphatase 2C domain-containing protein [Shinella kummerowiae]